MTPRQNDPPVREMLASLHDRLRTERGWRGRLRSLGTPGRVLLVLLGLALLALVIAITTLRPDLGAYPAVRFGSSLLIPALVSLAAVCMLFRPLGLPPLRGRLRWGLAIAAVLTPAAIAVAPQAHDLVHLHPESFADEGPQFWPRAGICLLFGCLTALPVLALILVFDRAPRLASDRLLLAGAFGGLAATIVLQLHCPLVSVDHLLAGHATVPFALLLLLAGLRLFSRPV